MRRYARDCPATTTSGTRAISPRAVCGYTHQRAMSSTANTPTKRATMVRNIRRRTSQPVQAGSFQAGSFPARSVGVVGMSSEVCASGKCVAAAASPESLLWAEESAELCSAWTGEGARPHAGTAFAGVGLGVGRSGRSSVEKFTRAPRCQLALARFLPSRFLLIHSLLSDLFLSH